MVGGSSDPSVPWSPGVTLQENAGRPMGPSTLRCSYLWDVVVVFVFGSSGLCLFVVKPLLFPRGRLLLSGPLSPSRPDPCLFFNCLSSSFLSLSGAFVDAVSLSLSFFLSLSGAGETQTPCGVWVSPCVLCIPAANFVFYPYSVVLNFPKASPRTSFFFSSLDRRLGVFLVSCLVGVGGHGGCLLWSVMVRCLPLPFSA